MLIVCVESVHFHNCPLYQQATKASTSDTLVYADLDLVHLQRAQASARRAEAAEPTEYVDIDFTKKAPPMLDSDNIYVN